MRERRWGVWQCGWFGVRKWSTGFEPVAWSDKNSPFGFLTLIYMFCALAGWWGTIWRASTDPEGGGAAEISPEIRLRSGTPPPVGPCFRRKLISCRPKLQQNQTGLPNHSPKPTPAWLGGAMRRSRAITKNVLFRHFFCFANLRDGAHNAGKTERRGSRCLFAL